MKFLPEIIILDRVIHHWLIRKLNPLFEELFINDSYACRVGKGTHFGVQRIYILLNHAHKIILQIVIS